MSARPSIHTQKPEMSGLPVVEPCCDGFPIGKCNGSCTMGAMRRFYRDIMGPELKSIQSGLVDKMISLEADAKETKEDLDTVKVEVKNNKNGISLIDRESMRMQRENASFMIRVKGSALPKKKDNEDLAKVFISIASKHFSVDVRRESIVSARRTFNQKSIIVR